MAKSFICSWHARNNSLYLFTLEECVTVRATILTFAMHIYYAHETALTQENFSFLTKKRELHMQK